MQKKLTASDAIYRVYRLRRLLTLTVGLPLIALLLTSLVGPGLSLDVVGIAVLVIWSAFAITAMVYFPNGWMEIAAMTVALVVLILLSPLAALLGIGPVLGTILTIIAMIVAMLQGTVLLTSLADRPVRQLQLSFRRKSNIEPEKLRDALFLRPDAQVGLHTCGPADENGVFPVTAQGYDLQAFEAVPCQGDLTAPISFWARIEENDGERQLTQVFTDEGSLLVSMEEQIVTPTARGSVYEKTEVVDRMDQLSALGFWLNDVEADHFTALVDHLQANPPKAIKHAPQDSLIIALLLLVTGGSTDPQS